MGHPCGYFLGTSFSKICNFNREFKTKSFRGRISIICRSSVAAIYQNKPLSPVSFFSCPTGLLLKSHESTFAATPPWSGFHSSVAEKPHFRTNIGVLPIIPNPVTEWSTVYTALKIMQGISAEVCGPERKTTITLDLVLYEKAVQLVHCNPALKEKFNLRLGELHILMAHLRGIGTYINSSGIDSIWIESGVYGPTTTRSILACTHLKRAFQAHEDTICALYQLFMQEFYKEHPEEEQEFRNIIVEHPTNKDRMESLTDF